MNKKKHYMYLLFDTILLVVILGVAYATFNYAKPGTKVNKIIAGAITMSYTESSNKISIANATPMSDASGEAMAGDGEYFDFTISTSMTTSQPISYEVTAEKDNESTLFDDEVRLYLEKYEAETAVASGESIDYEEVFSPKAFTPIDNEDATGEDSLGASNSEMLLDTGEITTDKTVYYRLRMWIAEGYSHTQDAKTYEVTVNVYGKDVKVEGANGINLSKSSLTMQKGETKQISATITPESTKNKNLIWTSSNHDVVRVDSSGNITAVATGIATVRVQTSDKTKYAECIVTVVDADAESVSLNTENVTLVRGSTNQLTATVLPIDASDKSVTWSSASNGIATVSSTGLITAVGIGVTTVTVETVNDKTATCEVTVVAPSVDTITISGANTVDIGSTTQLTVANASGETTGEVSSLDLVWSSSDTSKATVSSNGLVTGIGAGSVTITASVKEYPDIYATKVITVQQPEIRSITMSSDMTIYEGNTAIFTISYLPSNAGNIEDIEWISSNTSVAEVDCDGQTYCEIEGLGGGSTTITARTTNAIYDTATLTVEEPQPLVPVMTSDTTPSGQVIYSSQYDLQLLGWHAFTAPVTEGGTYWGWVPSKSDSFNNAYCGYVFPQNTKITLAKAMISHSNPNNYLDLIVKLQVSDDGVSWTDITTSKNCYTNQWTEFKIINVTNKRYYRFLIVGANTGGITSGSGWYFQFYGY